MRPWHCNYGSLCGTGSDLSSRRMRSWVLLPVCRAWLVIGPEGSRTWQLLYIKACVRSLTWRLYCVAIQLVFKTWDGDLDLDEIWNSHQLSYWGVIYECTLSFDLYCIIICLMRTLHLVARGAGLVDGASAPVTCTLQRSPCATRKHLSRNGHTFGSYFVALLVQLVKICLHLVV